MKKKSLLTLHFAFCILWANAQPPTRYVDPYIGTAEHGHVFLGAHVPRGMVQLGPTQETQGWDWCSGYNYADSLIVGFGHHHLSGTGIGDLGDISLMPVVGAIQWPDQKSAYRESSLVSRFSHEREEARAGYYSVHLDRHHIGVELTATTRVGMHRYHFPATDRAQIAIDLLRGIGWDALTEARLEQDSPTQISGYRLSTGWAPDQRVFFCIEFSQPIEDFSVEGPFGRAKFTTTGKEPIVVKVALSPVGIANARENLQKELPGWDFDKTAEAAGNAWDRALQCIDFRTKDEAVKKIFYTALYHYMTAPFVFQDVNGEYRGADGKTHVADGFTNHTVFSLWDTYRAAHPLATIIDPAFSRDVATCFQRIFEQQGKLPVWHLMGNETDCMVGNPGACVLADLVLKGYVGDERAAYKAMKASAMRDERGLDLYKEYGYIPYDLPGGRESVGRSMEYAIADGAIAQVALRLGEKEDADYFTERSKAYEHFFDRRSQFIRGLSSTGSFIEPLEPTHSAHEGHSVYTEGNAWQYTFLVPQDVHGLVGLFPSEEAFVRKLDEFFVVEGDPGPNAPPDVTGLIGQYAQGNEPSHHVAYMYNYVGQPWKTAERVREIMSRYYTAAPDGLCGNEDGGQMSAWYILSAMGFYQVAPAGGVYVFGTPLMDEAVIRLDGGRTFTVRAIDNSPENKYIQSVKLNGKPYTPSYITHDRIMAGGTLEFTMGSNPSAFGTAKKDRP